MRLHLPRQEPANDRAASSATTALEQPGAMLAYEAAVSHSIARLAFVDDGVSPELSVQYEALLHRAREDGTEHRDAWMDRANAALDVLLASLPPEERARQDRTLASIYLLEADRLGHDRVQREAGWRDGVARGEFVIEADVERDGPRSTFRLRDAMEGWLDVRGAISILKAVGLGSRFWHLLDSDPPPDEPA